MVVSTTPIILKHKTQLFFLDAHAYILLGASIVFIRMI